QRINNLEQRLVNISQELQSMYDSSSYAQQALGVEKTNALSNLQQIYSNNTSSIAGAYQGSTDTDSLNQYNQALQQEQLSLMYNQMIQNSLFTAKESAMQDSINQAETQRSEEHTSELQSRF